MRLAAGIKIIFAANLMINGVGSVRGWVGVG